MKIFSRLIIALGFVAATYSAVQCQDYAKDTFRVSVAYGRTDFPTYGNTAEVENVNSLTAEGDFKLFNFSINDSVARSRNKGRVSVAYKFNRKFNQEVFPSYFDGMGMVDLYRDVDTHSVGGQIGYAFGNAVEPFAALFYGSRKIHEDTPYQLVRTVRLGVNVPFAKSSPFFLKGALDYEQPYGTLPMGFINPYNRSLNFGFGFRF